MEIVKGLKKVVIGKNELWEQRDLLSLFVEENFDTLYEGGVRLGLAIPEDYYAGRRVQINRTRLHKFQALKYADGHKYSDEAAPSAENLRQTVNDINCLLEAAAQPILSPIRIIIEEPINPGN